MRCFGIVPLLTTTILGLITPQLEAGGTFWVDRWGQGRFAPYGDFVDESLFSRLKSVTGQPVQLTDERVFQRTEPGVQLLTNFRQVNRAPAAVTINATWMEDANVVRNTAIHRMRSSHTARLEIVLTNGGASDLRIASNDLRFCQYARHPPESNIGAARKQFGMFGGLTTEPKNVWRIGVNSIPILPRETTLDFSDTGRLSRERTDPEFSITLKPGRTRTWQLSLTGLLPNEYEFLIQYRDATNPVIDGSTFVFSNRLSLDVISEVGRTEDLLQIEVRQREEKRLAAAQQVPLEIVFRNRSDRYIPVPMNEMTTDEYVLSDVLFCYGANGRLLQLNDIKGLKRFRIPANGTLVVPVDAPFGTVVARCVFYDSGFLPKLNGSYDPDRFLWGWHWSGHWIAPSIRQQLDAAK